MATSNRWITLIVAAACAAGGCAAAPKVADPLTPALPTSATANGQTIVAIAPPAQACCPKQTLPQFLGLTGLGRGIGGLIDRLRNRLGSRYPGLEAKPELLSITDPANAESSNPAIASAAAVKAEEDAAAQKIKAIRYLATVGCGDCYPDIQDALLAALDDCTEAVRFEAVSALRKTAGSPCVNCKAKACCSPKVTNKLFKIVNDRTDDGCFKESSDRVRRIAKLAMCQCGGPAPPPPENNLLPKEGVSEEPPESTTVGNIKPPFQDVKQAAAVLNAGSERVEPVFAQLLGHDEPAAQEARWEHIRARLDQFPTRMDANAVMAMIRIKALGGTSQLPRDIPLSAVQSQPHAWASIASVSSPELARVLSQTPVGGVSTVWEDGGWLHMVRVLERRTAVPSPGPVQAAAHAMPSGTPYPTPAATAAVPKTESVLVRPPCNCDH